MSCDPTWEVCDTTTTATTADASNDDASQPRSDEPPRKATPKGAAAFLVNLMWANVLWQCMYVGYNSYWNSVLNAKWQATATKDGWKASNTYKA